MPLFQIQHFDENTMLGLWQLTEEEAFFLTQLHQPEVVLADIQNIKGKRRVESLAVRYLLQLLSGDQAVVCLKDEYGKPYIQNSNQYISLSHTTDWAAVFISSHLVGMDIQRIVEKIDTLAHKFMRPEEMHCIHPEHHLAYLSAFWGAKEALYKAYGKRQLDFKENIIIQPFDYQNFECKTKGVVQKDEILIQFDILIQTVENIVVVTAIEEPTNENC